MEKVTYSTLSIPLKVAVIMSYVVGSIYAFYLVSGFVIGFVGAI